MPLSHRAEWRARWGISSYLVPQLSYPPPTSLQSITLRSPGFHVLLPRPDQPPPPFTFLDVIALQGFKDIVSQLFSFPDGRENLDPYLNHGEMYPRTLSAPNLTHLTLGLTADHLDLGPAIFHEVGNTLRNLHLHLRMSLFLGVVESCH